MINRTIKLARMLVWLAAECWRQACMSFGGRIHAGKGPNGSVHTGKKKCSLEVDVLGPASCQCLIKNLHCDHRAMMSTCKHTFCPQWLLLGTEAPVTTPNQHRHCMLLLAATQQTQQDNLQAGTFWRHCSHCRPDKPGQPGLIHQAWDSDAPPHETLVSAWSKSCQGVPGQ